MSELTPHSSVTPDATAPPILFTSDNHVVYPATLLDSVGECKLNDDHSRQFSDAGGHVWRLVHGEFGQDPIVKAFTVSLSPSGAVMHTSPVRVDHLLCDSSSLSSYASSHPLDLACPSCDDPRAHQTDGVVASLVSTGTEDDVFGLIHLHTSSPNPTSSSARSTHPLVSHHHRQSKRGCHEDSATYPGCLEGVYTLSKGIHLPRYPTIPPSHSHLPPPSLTLLILEYMVAHLQELSSLVVLIIMGLIKRVIVYCHVHGCDPVSSATHSEGASSIGTDSIPTTHMGESEPYDAGDPVSIGKLVVLPQVIGHGYSFCYLETPHLVNIWACVCAQVIGNDRLPRRVGGEACRHQADAEGVPPRSRARDQSAAQV